MPGPLLRLAQARNLHAGCPHHAKSLRGQLLHSLEAWRDVEEEWFAGEYFGQTGEILLAGSRKQRLEH